MGTRFLCMMGLGLILLAGCLGETRELGPNQIAWTPHPCDPGRSAWISKNAEQLFPPAEEEAARQILLPWVKQNVPYPEQAIVTLAKEPSAWLYRESMDESIPRSHWGITSGDFQALDSHQKGALLQSLVDHLTGNRPLTIQVYDWNQTFQEMNFSFAEAWQPTQWPKETLRVAFFDIASIKVYPVYAIQPEIDAFPLAEATALADKFVRCYYERQLVQRDGRIVSGRHPENVDMEVGSDNPGDSIYLDVVDQSVVYFVVYPLTDSEDISECGTESALEVAIDAVSGAIHGVIDSGCDDLNG